VTKDTSYEIPRIVRQAVGVCIKTPAATWHIQAGQGQTTGPPSTAYCTYLQQGYDGNKKKTGKRYSKVRSSVESSLHGSSVDSVVSVRYERLDVTYTLDFSIWHHF
jgi:hypothetical protein